MRHRKAYKNLGRKSSHRVLMLRSMICDLITNGRLKTTLPKIVELRPLVERVITKAKKTDVASANRIFSILGSAVACSEVKRIANSKYSSRSGGYTRVVKLGFRKSDGANMAVIELVD